MATQDDVRRIALSLPDAVQEEGRFSFAVPRAGKLRGFVWVWLERAAPKKPRVPRPDVIAVRVASLAEKDFVLAMDSRKFFTEPHYNGYPAVLARLDELEVGELEVLITDAWRCQAPKALVKDWEARERGGS